MRRRHGKGQLARRRQRLRAQARRAVGTRCEIKNVNSIRFIGQAIETEARRQIAILEDGGAIVQETRLFDPTRGETAAELIANRSESELADIIFNYGEERAARRIARAIKARAPGDTAQLAALVAGVVHVRGRRERTHPATRTFQALRIAVNDELGALSESLAAALERTVAGGRVAAISFHSLEDRIVKQLFRDDPHAVRLTRKPILPSAAEIAANPRARSAKLRVCSITHPAPGGLPA